VDALFGLTGWWTPGLVAAALGIGVLGGIGNLVLRSVHTHAAVAA
jgi:hypothetical protein